jgi:hypothetical protein
MYRIVFVSLLILFASTAHATIDSSSRKASGKQPVDVSLSFEDQKRAIETDLADGETYSEIERKDRETVTGALQRISSALANHSGVAGLSDAEKAAVFNDQELINNILTRANEDSRLVCVREKKVGSHRTTTQCATVADRRRASEESQKALRDNQGLKMPPVGN